MQGHGYGNVTVCYSRIIELPRDVARPLEDIECKTIFNDAIEINLDEACNDYENVGSCPTLFISIEGIIENENKSFNCVEKDCRFSDDIKISFNTIHLGCFV